VVIIILTIIILIINNNERVAIMKSLCLAMGVAMQWCRGAGVQGVQWSRGCRGAV
jgi:hypothetical protein